MTPGRALAPLLAAAVLAGCGDGDRAPAHPAIAGPPVAPAPGARPGAPVKVAGTTLSAAEVAAAASGAPVAAGPRPDLQPLPARAFRAPIARYRAYSARQVAAMAVQVRALVAALRAGDRAGARRAWGAAYARYLRLGAAYGALGALDEAIDGLPSAHFRGLHRLERGLWTGAPAASLVPYATRLQADVRRLRGAVQRVEITPLDYATRAHEILEDAQRDMLSGDAAPWSGAGVRATAAALAATDAVIGTLGPVLAGRDVLAPVETGLQGLREELGRAAARARRPAGARRALAPGARAAERAPGRRARAARRDPGRARDDAPARRSGDPAVKVDRRRFLTRSALALGAVAGVEAAGAAEAGAPALAARPDTLRERVPFDGRHQAGILTAPRDAAVLAALDAVAPDRARLIQGLQALSSRARELARGGRLPVEEVDEPPSDSGILGTEYPADALTVTIAFGASLFDERYGLAARRPPELARMTPFPNDRLDPALTHGDVLLALSAHRPDTVSHALRELLRPVRDAFAPRWWIDGFQGAARGPSARSSPRNLFGFRDGTGNPDTNDGALMRRLVWTPEGGTTWPCG